MIKFYLFLSLIKLIKSHSWLDCTDRRPDGSCGGYIRNYQGHYDIYSSYKILDKNPISPLCEPRFQSNPLIYAPNYPMAKAKPGQTLFIDYLENGHVNLDRLPPDNKPHPKYYSIYMAPKPFIGDMNDGSQMILRKDLEKLEPLVQLPFDDGECADITYFGRQGPKPCIGSYKIPKDIPLGTYMFVWIWHFDRDLNAKGEEYTSCFDVEIIEPKIYNSGHSLVKFPPYTPIKLPDIIDNETRVKNINKIDCDSLNYDKNIYECHSSTLCPKGNQLCGNNGCYDPIQFKCCNGNILLRIEQDCIILNNPFERLKDLFNKV